MNDLMLTLGLEAFKPMITSLLLPPVPWLLVMLLGGRLLARQRPGLGWSLLLGGAFLVFAGCTSALGGWLTQVLLHPPPAIDERQLVDLRRVRPGAPKSLIVVLGGGRYPYAPEYGMSNLTPISMERLRYGLWLGRETGLPVGFSGGLSPGAGDGPTEAEIAARISAREFGRPLAWTEGESRDTRENARRTMAWARTQGIERIVLVTHELHMTRALRNFELARRENALNLSILPAPLAVTPHGQPWVLADFYPTPEGIARTRYAVREWLGLLAGA